MTDRNNVLNTIEKNALSCFMLLLHCDVSRYIQISDLRMYEIYRFTDLPVIHLVIHLPVIHFLNFLKT